MSAPETMTPAAAVKAYTAQLQQAMPDLSLTGIIGIISTFLNMFGGCFGGTTTPTPTPPPTAASVKDMVKNNPIIARVRINMAMRSEGMKPFTPQGMRIHDEVVKMVETSSDVQLNAFIAYAHNQG